MAPYQHPNPQLKRAGLHAVMCVLAATSGCVPLSYNDRCGPEFRDEWTEAPLHDDAGTDFGKAIFTVVERRGSDLGTDPLRAIGLTLLGPRSGTLGGPLKGLVTAVVLGDAAGPLQWNFPVTPPPFYGIEIVGSTTIAVDDIGAFSAVRQTMIAGQLRIHIETSPGAPTVSDVRFPASSPREWSRLLCTI